MGGHRCGVCVVLCCEIKYVMIGMYPFLLASRRKRVSFAYGTDGRTEGRDAIQVRISILILRNIDEE